MNNIDEKAIIEFCGFEWATKNHFTDKAEVLGWWIGDSYEGDDFNIYSLDWQAKYLWPKLKYLNIYYDKKLGFACFVDNGMVCYDKTGKDLATAVLGSVMELIGGK